MIGLLLVCIGPHPSAAAEVASLSGKFALQTERSDDIERAINQAVAPMSFIAQVFARRRLRQINTVYPLITIRTSGEDVTVVADPRIPVRTPLNGAPVGWKREDGEPFTVSGKWDGAAFEQTFVSGTGRRVNRYSLSPDGQTLSMRVVVTGGGLPGAMTYQLVYRRSG